MKNYRRDDEATGPVGVVVMLLAIMMVFWWHDAPFWAVIGLSVVIYLLVLAIRTLSLLFDLISKL